MLRARRRTREGEDKRATHAACAPRWSAGQLRGFVVESDSDKCGVGKTAKRSLNKWLVTSSGAPAQRNPQFLSNNCMKIKEREKEKFQPM